MLVVTAAGQEIDHSNPVITVSGLLFNLLPSISNAYVQTHGTSAAAVD